MIGGADETHALSAKLFYPSAYVVSVFSVSSIACAVIQLPAYVILNMLEGFGVRVTEKYRFDHSNQPSDGAVTVRDR